MNEKTDRLAEIEECFRLNRDGPEPIEGSMERDVQWLVAEVRRLRRDRDEALSLLVGSPPRPSSTKLRESAGEEERV